VKKLKNSITVLLLFFIVFESCQKQEIKQNDNNKVANDSIITQVLQTNYTVSELNARYFAINYAKKHNIVPQNAYIKEVKQYKTGMNEKIIYAINFEPKAFMLVADDKRDLPIYGFSDKRYFEATSFEKLPGNIKGWLQDLTMQNIIIEKNIKLQEENHTQTQWNTFINMSYAGFVDPDSCFDYFMQTTTNTYDDAMLATKWGQDSPYNLLCPKASPDCANKAPTGCVATAIAQIVKFWHQPISFSYSGPEGNFYINDVHALHNSYNWSSTSASAYEVAKLMRIIGIEVDMSYGSFNIFGELENCNQSGANSSNAEDFFQNIYFNNSNIEYTDTPGNNTVRHNLTWGWPVYIRGKDNDGKGHAWVLDGYKEIYDEYERVCDGGFEGTLSGTVYRNYSAYNHMNFGWAGANNGWFNSLGVVDSYDYDPSTYNYNTGFGTTVPYHFDNKVIINIHP